MWWRVRILACVKCGQPVRVHEEPVEHIDPELFVGGCCLEPREQLELDGEREETRPYDPALARIPF
jgi:hypothetical protein